MEQLKVIGNSITRMCRLCLSHDVIMDDVFWFSSELGKKIADIIMECAPVRITRQDKMPTCICQLCFNQLKKFHQFQMQAVRSDRTLQRYLHQLSDCRRHNEVELTNDEQSDNSESQTYNTATKCDPLEISDEFDNFSSKHKVLANFTSVNRVNVEISLKSEIKDEPMDDNNSLILTECADTAETLSMYDSGKNSCEDSMIEVGDTKVGNFECPIKFEINTTEKIPLKKKETYIPLKDDDSSLWSENVKDVEGLRSFEDNLNGTERPSKRQNLNDKLHDFHSELLKQSATSTESKSHQCDICQMCFSKSGNLKNHKLTHTGVKRYKCDICQMRFRHSGLLKSHLLIHSGEKPYQCDLCKMCFRQLGHLKRHKLIHTGEKPYQCDICKMCFAESSKLKRHSFIHTGEKPYQCDICKMCFTESGTLKRHKLKHTGEKPYQCDICKTCFRQLCHLKSHKLTHTGEKPYQCDFCKMRFAELGTLKRHKFVHTGEKPYQCDICKMGFRQAQNFKRHKLKHAQNFSSVNKINEEISLKSEFKNEPMNEINSLILAETVETVKSLSIHDGNEISCEDSMIEIDDTKVGNFECPIKFEIDTTEKIPLKKEETYIPLKDDDSSLCLDNVKDVEGLCSFEDNLNKTEHPSKRQNLNDKSHDFRDLLKQSANSTESKSHQCDICQMCFKQSTTLKNHKLTHTGEKPHQCDICKMRFRQTGLLKSHILIHTGEKPYQCDICKYRFRLLGHLKRHKVIHTGEKPYRCDICKICFTESGSLKRHNLIHTGEKPFQCDICKMCFREASKLRSHKFVHTGEKPYQCDICKMNFIQLAHLKTHKLQHTGEKRFECDICKKCFCQSKNLKMHKLKHTQYLSSVNKINEEISLKSEFKNEPMDENNSLILAESVETVKTLSIHDINEISCEDSMIEFGDTKVGNFECPKKFEIDAIEKIPLKKEETYIPLKDENVKDVEGLCSFEDNLNGTEHPSKRQNLNDKSHDFRDELLKQSATSTESKSHQCDICQMCFSKSSNLKNHKLTHTGEKPHQCDICQMFFRQSATLNNHKLTHTVEKPYQCDICKMCFRLSGNLKRHKLIHTGEKPYQCDICKRCFAMSRTLKAHNLIHTGEKPHQCDICKMCFRLLDQLKNHKLTHTGEKPYECYICKMRFSQSQNLKRHKLTHTGEKPHQCDICKKGFRRAQNLIGHKLKHTQYFSLVNKINEEISLKSEIKNEPMDDSNPLSLTECADTAETLSMCDDGEISSENPMFEFCDTKAGNVICPIKFENDMTSQKSEENYTHSKKHVVTHAEEKPYMCDICKMGFRKMAYLKTHKLKHTGEKPYQCDICKMRFAELGTLKKHNLIHTGEKPYQCDICKMCFRQAQNLKRHKLIHTGEKPYQCDICKMGFTRSNYLKIHQLKHTQ